MSSSLGNGYIGINVNIINDATQDALDLKANTADVNAELATKATITYVDSQDLLKADLTYVNTQLGTKADTTYVDSELDDVDAVMATKATITYVDSQDLLKANLQNGNTFTGDQIVDNIIVGGQIKSAESAGLSFGVNSGGVPLTAMTLQSDGTADFESKTTFKQSIVGGVSQSLSAGTPVIDSLRLITKLDTRAGNIVATINNGSKDGQLKIINLHRADPQYTATILTNVSEPITLKNVGEGCILAWSGNTADWSVVSKNQKYITELLSVDDIEVRGSVKSTENAGIKFSVNNIGIPLTALTLHSDGDAEFGGIIQSNKSIVGKNSSSFTAGNRNIDSLRLITKLDTRAGNIVATINNGYEDGQLKIINLHRADPQYTATILTNVSEPIVLKNVGEGVILAWSGNTADWSVVSKNMSFLNNDLNIVGGANLAVSGGGYISTDGSLYVNGVGKSIQCRRIIPTSTEIIVGGDIAGDGHINLATGKEYRVDGVNILDAYRTSADSDTLLNAKADTSYVNTKTAVNADAIVTLTNSTTSAQNTLDGRITQNTQSIAVNSSLISQNTTDITALDNDKADIAGGNIFTGNQQTTGNYNLISGVYQIGGTNILDAYRTRADTDTLLNAKANENDVVNKFQNQTIAGVKTFEDRLDIEDNLHLKTDGSLIAFGADAEITLTHNHNVGLTTNGVMTATEYRINGTNILDAYRTSADSDTLLNAKADIAGGNTFTGNQQTTGNYNLISGVYQIGGTNILDAYRTRADTDTLLNAKANENDVVNKFQNQTIAGVKTFEDRLDIEDNLHLKTDGSLIAFGADAEITLTHNHNVGLTTNGVMTATEYRINGTNILDAYRTSADSDTLLDAKADIAGGNTFTGNQIFGSADGSTNASLKLFSNSGSTTSELIVDSRNDDNSCAVYMKHGGTNKFQMKLNQNSDYVIRNLATSQDEIRLPIGGGIELNDNVSVSGSMDLGMAREYKINGTNILTPYRTSADTDTLLDAKAPLAGNKTFTGGNVAVEGGYLAVADGSFYVNGAGRNIQCRRIIGTTTELLVGSNINCEYSCNLASGNIYKVGGVDILTPYRTSADTDTLLDAKANDNAVVKLTGDQTINGVKGFSMAVETPNLTSLTNGDITIKTRDANKTIYIGNGNVSGLSLTQSDFTIGNRSLFLSVSNIPQGTGVGNNDEPDGLTSGEVWRKGDGSSQTLMIKS